tara:strand:+ start:2566 stop:4497 length:1932 start_codon:yes stop_codon:yes gene_type:complete
MSLINFTSLDFEQIKELLKDYLKSNSDFTDYDFEGSNLSTIINLLAYNTYITSYNANMVTNEVFIDSATLRENVVSLAKNIGYLPKSRKASSANISFNVDATNIVPAPSTITLRKGPVAISSAGIGNQSYVYSILNDITVPVVNGIALFDSIKIYEGTFLSSSFTFSTRNPRQKFLLPNVGIDTDLINVSVKNSEQSTTSTTYNLYTDILNLQNNSKVFYIQESSDERYEIFFGDGIFGDKLDDSNYITAEYITSHGEAANGISGFAFTGSLYYIRNGAEYNATQGISAISTISPSYGGTSIESVESIRKYAPRIYGTQNRAVTAQDYEVLIPSKIYPETESISVFGGEELVPPQYGKVFISIKPKTGDFLSNLAKQEIKLRLKKYAVTGIVPEILDLKYLYIEVDSKIYYNSNQVTDLDVSTIVQNNASKYANSSELNRYGSRFKYSKFLKIIDDSHQGITSNITSISIRRDLRPVLNSFAEYAIGFGNSFHIKSTDGYNLKTTAFKVDGINSDVYLSDLPNADLETGSLFLFTLPSENSLTPTIVKRNVGTINYGNGIIILNPINITGAMLKNGQSIIEMSLCPSSNDVIGLQDLYLQLDTSNSIFETIIDNISSGLDPSASNYIVSSSYGSYSLVRPSRV